MRKPVLAITLLLLGLAFAHRAELRARFLGLTIGPRDSEVSLEPEYRAYLEEAYTSEQLREIQRDPAERAAARTRYLDHRATMARAHRLGIDRDARYRKALELMEMKVLARLMTERHRDRILRDSRVSPEAVKAYFEEHRREFTEEPRFTARHLLVYVAGNPAFPEQGLGDVAARAKAERALIELRAHGDWQVVARSFSDEVSTKDAGGLLRDRHFGYFAPEVEQAIRTQELGKPGGLIRSPFGYHIVQVEQRVLEHELRPFEAVKDVIARRLAEQRSAEARDRFMQPFWQELGFAVTEAGKRDVSLLDPHAVADGEVLATIAGRAILESDFQWFTRDALLPSQRVSAFSRPGARLSMLSAYLDMLVLEAKARKDGLDKSPAFTRMRLAEEASLLAEFVRGRDQPSPSPPDPASEPAREVAVGGVSGGASNL